MKKIISLTLAIIFVLSTSALSASWDKASVWAQSELDIAVSENLYPDKLLNADLTKPITRAEFAAAAVKLYETLSKTTATPAPSGIFTDTNDIDVLKAYNLDLVNGTGNGKFSPDGLLSREEGATMMTRVYKKLRWESWTLADDSAYALHTLDTAGVEPFADDDKISSWAKPSVYFMAKYDIIKGVGNNSFAPKNTTQQEIADNYATATREMALLFSVRLFSKIDEIDAAEKENDPTVDDNDNAPDNGDNNDDDNGEFNAIIAEILTLPRDEPRNGTPIGIFVFWDTFDFADVITGSKVYEKRLEGDFLKTDGSWQIGDSCELISFWQTIGVGSYVEILYAAGWYTSSTNCLIFDYKTPGMMTMYQWTKGATSGIAYTFPDDDYDDDYDDEDDSDFDDFFMNAKFATYGSQTILGETCRVYSITYRGETTYYWYSANRKGNIMMANYSTVDGVSTQTITYFYDYSTHTKPNSFFTPPSDILFQPVSE